MKNPEKQSVLDEMVRLCDSPGQKTAFEAAKYLVGLERAAVPADRRERFDDGKPA